MADNSPQVEDVSKTAPAGEGPDINSMTLETLVMLINTERLKYLQETTDKELNELKDRQQDVRTLHKVMKAINGATDEKGNLDISKNQDLQKLMKEAKDLGIDIKDGKNKYNKEERDRLVENLKMGVEDLNVQNEMQLQKVNRLTNERYESYQLARTILKPLHDDKLSKARAIAGR